MLIAPVKAVKTKLLSKLPLDVSTPVTETACVPRKVCPPRNVEPLETLRNLKGCAMS